MLSISLSGKLNQKQGGEQRGRRGNGEGLNRGREGDFSHSRSENMKGLTQLNELIKLKNELLTWETCQGERMGQHKSREVNLVKHPFAKTQKTGQIRPVWKQWPTGRD